MFDQPDLDLRPVGIGAGVLLAGAFASAITVGLENATVLFVGSAVLAGLVVGWLVSPPDDDGFSLKIGAFHGFHSVGLGGIVLVSALLIGDAGATVGSSSLALVVASPMGIVVFPVIGLVAGAAGTLLRVAYDSVREPSGTAEP